MSEGAKGPKTVDVKLDLATAAELADFFAARGKPDNALQTYAAVLKLDPHIDDVRRRRDRYLPGLEIPGLDQPLAPVADAPQTAAPAEAREETQFVGVRTPELVITKEGLPKAVEEPVESEELEEGAEPVEVEAPAAEAEAPAEESEGGDEG